MVKWLCTICNIYIYDEEKGDPDTGIIPNTRLSEFADSWRCPVCGATIDKFIRIPENDNRQKATQHSVRNVVSAGIELLR